MSITQTYVDYATGNDYKGASFTDGAYTSATKTLVKLNAFAASKVNHWLYLSSNDGGSIVTGYYKIATWTDASTVILATDAGAGVDDDAVKCTQADGTTTLPWRSVQGALDLITRDSTNGDQVNVKVGTAQVIAASLVLTTYGTPTLAAPLVFRGYTSAAGDGGIADIDGAASYSILYSTTLDYIHFIDCHLHNVGDRNIVRFDNSCSLINCEIDTGPASSYAVLHGARSVIVGCNFHDVSNAIYGSSGLIYGNRIAVTSSPALFGNGTETIVRNIITVTGTSSKAITDNGSGLILDNTIYSADASTNAGIIEEGGASAVLLAVINNIISGWSGAGGDAIDLNGGYATVVIGNAYYNCTNTETDFKGLPYTANNDTLGGNPFVSAGTDFDINGTVTGVTEDAFPLAFGGLANTMPKADKGAVQAGAGTSSSGVNMPRVRVGH